MLERQGILGVDPPEIKNDKIQTLCGNTPKIISGTFQPR